MSKQMQIELQFVNVPEDVRTQRKKKLKSPDLPIEAVRQRSDDVNGCGNCTNGSSVHTCSVANDWETKDTNLT